MREVATIALVPPRELRYRHRLRLLQSATEIWRNRQLVGTLVRRDFTARYKQAILGLAWSILQPLALVAVFVLFIRRIAHVETHGVSYVLYIFAGLMFWQLFSGAVSGATLSLVNNQALLNKVYCPREVFPVAAVVLALVDAAVSVLAFVIILAVNGFVPRSTSYWIPVLVALHLAFTLGVSLVVSITVVYIRDLRQVLPLLLQLGLFATPVAWSFDQLPANARLAYSFFNPNGPIIDSYRRTVLLGQSPDLRYLGAAAITTVVVLIGGFALFKRLEPGISDII